MEFMFYRASSFNQLLNDWNTGNVTNMSFMFSDASSFNGDITDWDVNNVTDMNTMFENAVLFNKNLWNWHLKSETVIVSYMFGNATAALLLGYNETPSITQDSNGIWRLSDVTPPNLFQPTTKAQLQTAVNGWIDGVITADSPVPSGQGSGTYGVMNTWDVSLITDMSALFEGKQNFNEDISNWNVSSVIDMYGMFALAFDFNQPLNDWNTSSVATMVSMFEEASSFNQDISGWDTSSVTDMGFMFYQASAFNQNISNWCVTNIASEPTEFSTNSSLTQSNKPVWGSCPTASVDDQNQLDISIYPNPTSDMVNIDGNYSQLKAVVYDILGKQVMKESITNSLDISQLEKGVYILQLSDGVKLTTQRILKK
jgi:surface protein